MILLMYAAVVGTLLTLPALFLIALLKSRDSIGWRITAVILGLVMLAYFGNMLLDIY